MKKFKSKKDLFDYIKNKFLEKDLKGIIVIGSTAKGKIKNFSDIDIVIFNEKNLKPFYELCLVNKKLVLITVYFYKSGKVTKVPKNGKIIYGNNYEQIEHKNNLKYSKEKRTIRDNQMFLDGLFKFLRSKDEHYLNWIDKYSNLLIK